MQNNLFLNGYINPVYNLLKNYRKKVLKLLSLLLITTFFESFSLALIPSALNLLTSENEVNKLPSYLNPISSNFSSKEIGIAALIIILLTFIAKHFFDLTIILIL